MSTDNKSDQPQDREDSLKNFILLTLPWLSFQLEILEIAKKNLQDANTIKPTERFTFNELHALMMILDPGRTFRNRDPDFEKKIEDTYKEIVPKLASASVQLIEAQQQALAGLFDGLNTLRKGPKADKRSET